MNPNLTSVFDAFLNLIGVMGVWPALYRLHVGEKHNPFEDVLKWVLTLLSAFWFVRGFFDFFNMESLGGLLYALSIAFAFCVFLFFEIILRRHYPLWFKIYLSFGLAVFFVMALIGQLEGHMKALIVFGPYVLSLVLIIFTLAITRRKSDYGKNENASINTSIWFLLFLAPLFLTDVSTYKMPIPPLGITGGLIFTYFTIYNQALFFGRWFLLRKLGKSLISAVLLTLAVHFLINSEDSLILGRFFVLFLELLLLFRIYFAVYYLNGEDEMHLFVDNVNEASKKSIPAFMLQMRSYYDQFEAKLLRPSDISDYDSSEIRRFFEDSKMVLISRYEVLRWIHNYDGRWTSTDLECIEKMRDILETHEKTHLCKLGSEKPFFILFNCPFISYEKILDSQTELLAQLSVLIEKSE